MIKRVLAVGAAACLTGVVGMTSASASGSVGGGALSCSGTTRFVGVESRGSGYIGTFTDGIQRNLRYSSGVSSYGWDSSFHYIGSWRVDASDTVSASGSYSYCWYTA